MQYIFKRFHYMQNYRLAFHHMNSFCGKFSIVIDKTDKSIDIFPLIAKIAIPQHQAALTTRKLFQTKNSKTQTQDTMEKLDVSQKPSKY